MTEERRAAERLTELRALYRAYIKPDSGMTVHEFAGRVIEVLDKPI